MDTLVADDPQRLGDYWLSGRLGSGGQGVVYEAYAPDGQRVAVKVLRDDAAGRARIEREVAAARRVASFCTARVLDVGSDGKHTYIVSEYVEGPSLREAVREGRPFTGDDLHRLATAIATALTAIHEAGVVHRDLKPDNVLLGPDGPRVIDFGIARTADMSLTTSGVVAGTPTYMAPEVFTGQRAQEPADVFAWAGIVLFAATGEDPFLAESLGGVMHRVLSTDPDLTALPRSLRPLVASALAKEPETRPTARELLQGLISGFRGSESELLALGSTEAGLLTSAPVAEPALGALAEEAYEELSPAEREWVPQLFLRMVGVRADGEIIRRGVTLTDLYDGRSEQERETIRKILTGFERLLIPEIESAHPDEEITLARLALVQAWPRLRGWVSAERSGLAALNELSMAALRWNRGRDSDLLQGERLDKALSWAATDRRLVTLSRLEREFLAASTALTRRRARRRRGVIATLAALLALAVSGGVISLLEGRVIAADRDAAESRSLAAQAGAMRGTDPVRAMLLSVAAWRVGHTAEAKAALVSSLAQREREVLALPGRRFALSGDGRIAAAIHDGTVSIWDTRTGRRIGGWPGLEPDDRAVHAIALDAGGTRLAVASGTFVRVWDVAKGEALKGTYPIHPDKPEGHYSIDVEFGPAKDVLIVTDGVRTGFWNLRTGTRSRRAHAYRGAVNPAGTFAATDGLGQRLQLWRLPHAKAAKLPKRACPGHVGTAAFSPDGRHLACFSDQGITLSDLVARKAVTWESSGQERGFGLTFSPDGDFLASYGDDLIKLWRVSDGTLLFTYRAPGPPAEVRFDGDGRSLRYLLDGTVRTLDVADLVLPTVYGEALGVNTLSPDGRLIASVSNDGTGRITVTDTTTGKPSGVPFPAQADSNARQIGFSRDGRVMGALVSDGTRVMVWDTTARRRLATTAVPAAEQDDTSLTAVAVSPDGSAAAALMSGPKGVDVLVADIRTGVWRKVTTLDESEARILAFSSDGGPGKGMLAVLTARTGYLVPLGTGRVRSLSSAPEENTVLVSAAFSPAGTLVTGDSAGRLFVWDTATGERRGPVLRTGGGAVQALAFSGGGRVLAAGGQSGGVSLWDVTTGRPIGDPLTGPVGGVASLTFDGGTLIVADVEGGVLRYQVEGDRIARVVCDRAGRDLTEREWRAHVPDLTYRHVCR